MDLITDLRKKIDSHHEDAIRALGILKGYLASESLPSVNGHSSKRAEKKNRLKTRTGKRGSFREAVSKVIKNTWASIEKIATETGLTSARVRGVVNAPSLRGKIEIQEIGGKKEYRLNED